MTSMQEAREETKYADGSPTPRMSKLDTILFDSDEGPASSLFSKGGVQSNFSPVDPMVRSLGFDQNVASPIPFNSPAVVIATPSEVKVRDKSAVHDNKLREQLEKVQTELDTERKNRKRKEKSLIKLAKELNKRSVEKEAKEKAILEMSETIEDLENRLGNRNREVVVDLPVLKARCAKQEAELADYSRESMRLREQLDEARMELDKAKGSLITHLSKRLSFSDVSFTESDEVFVSTREMATNSSSEKSGSTLLSRIVFLVVLCVALVLGASVRYDITMDDVCAPVRPGSRFYRSDEVVLEAPWWVPEPGKDLVFAALCGNRDRMRLEAKKGTINVSSVSTGKIVWTGRALGGFSIDDDAMTMRNFWGGSESISPPWSS